MITKSGVQCSMVNVRESKEAVNNVQRCLTIFAVVFVIHLLPFAPHLSSSVCHAAEYSLTETEIINFIKELYNNSDDIQVSLNTMPTRLKDNTMVKSVSFKKIPDANGNGICMVEVLTGAGTDKNVQVPFRVLAKRKLFVLNRTGRKDQIIRKGDLSVRKTYMNGKGNEYPSSFEDLTGKILKKDVPANTVLTYRMLEEPVAVQRGKIVNLVAENRKLLVITKGKTIEKGRIGDVIRVKNISSGKEVAGRVAAYNTVEVDF